MTTRLRKTGEFCWVNILTPEPGKARAFFASLLGWTYTPLPGDMGHGIHVDGKRVGGIFDLAAPGTPPGTPPGIGVMIRVDDADAVGERIRKLGGKAAPGVDVMDQGRMVACVDPTGAAFDLWQPRKSPGMEAEGTEHGAPSWFESITPDVARASKFYATLFGWKAEAMEMPGFTYTSFKLGETWVAGMMAPVPEMGEMPPFWGVYFTVRDVDATVAAAEKAGASVCVPANDVPGVGRFAGLISPQGVMFSVMTYEPM